MKNYRIFDEYKTNSVGVWYFVPQDGAFRGGKPCHGFGCIKYAEGSVYTGDIYYDGIKFNKLGFGKQDFSRSSLGGIIPAINERKYMFIGEYDYLKTDWIYGNGVMYYTDANGNPGHFTKGFFRGLDRVGDYEGDFDYSQLADGYTPDMEFEFSEYTVWLDDCRGRLEGYVKNAEEIDTLFIGDSYFELFNSPDFAGKNLFKDYFPKNYANFGLGGTKFFEWEQWLDKLRGIPKPKKIIINLGFNDIHYGKSAKTVYDDGMRVINGLRNLFPSAEVYLISVIHSPGSVVFLDEENKYNAMIAENAQKNGLKVGDWNDRISACGENCFHPDLIHPNERGYALFRDFITEFLK